MFGSSIQRAEDPRFLTGAAAYVEDRPPADALWAVFVRSPLAHARIEEVDVADAAAQPGVVAIDTAADLALPAVSGGKRAPEATHRPVLAGDTVRFAGEAVAMVVAESRAAAVDAAEAVLVDYDPLEAVTDAEAARAPDAPLLFPEHGSNVVTTHRRVGDVAAAERPDDVDALADAEVTVSGRFVNQRVAPLPLEPNAVLAIPDGEGLVVHASTQIPITLRRDLARSLGLAEEAVRVVAGDVGGAFGAKLIVYPEQLAVASAARRLGRPVRWVEDRSENLQAMSHGRAQVQHVTVGARRDGVITGLRARVVADIGAYPTFPGLMMPGNTLRMACGPYHVPKVDLAAECVVTTTTPVSAYRGAGRPEATAMIERAIDLLAAELDLDPAEVRRRNLLTELPHTTVTGATYDEADYLGALEQALAAADYDGVRRDQAERRARGDRCLLGVGMATYVEVTAGGMTDEMGSVEVDGDGLVTVRTGLSPHGQGHETSLAQLASGVLGVPFDQVRVRHSDTAEVAVGKGTMGSRSLQIGGSAVHAAATTVLAKARRLAAHLLEVAEHDVEVVDGGRLAVAGVPERGLTWAELARAAGDPERLPPGMEPGLAAEEVFEQPDATYPSGAHVAVVEVDRDTGQVTPLHHVAADDCGLVLNPMLVDGQVHGGLAQGVAQALHEEITYDELGNCLQPNLATYAAPGAPDLPEAVLVRPQTPTSRNPLGAKGIGESATIGSTPAVQNAVVDALSPFGVRHVDLPCTPQRVWQALLDGGD